MFKLPIKPLVNECVNGNFQNVYQQITKRNDFDFANNNACKLIIGICNACHKKISTPECLNEEDLIILVKHLLKLIHNPDDEVFYSYAQSIFFILKLLIKKKNLNAILQLKDMFMPEFMPSSLNEKHIPIYQNISNSIYRVISETVQTNDNRNQDTIVKLAYLCTDLCKKIGYKILLEIGFNCTQKLIIYELDQTELLKFYYHIIKTVDKEDPILYCLIISNFSIIYSSLLKNNQYDFASLCYINTMKHLNQFYKSKDYQLLSEILKIIDFFNPKNQLKSKQTPGVCNNSLKNYYRWYNSSKQLQTVCEFITSIVTTVISLFKKNDLWQKNSQVSVPIFQLLNNISMIITQITNNPIDGLRSLNLILILARLNLNTSRLYTTELLKTAERSIEIIQKVKEESEKWNKYWNDLSVHLYTIGVKFHELKNTEMSILFLQKFIRTTIYLEGFKPQILNKDYLYSALNIIARCYFDSQDYEKCLVVTAISIIVNDTPTSEINVWLKSKVESREKRADLHELTIVSICHKYQSDVKVYIQDGLNLCNSRKIELLLYELRQYNAKWKSKIPMYKTFKELYDISSTQLAAEVLIEIWGNADIPVNDSLPKLLQDIIRKVELEEIDNKMLLLTHLYYLQHKYKIKEVLVKHCDEMEKTLSLVKDNKCIEDECDLISSYENLKLSLYVTMMKNLDKSIELAQKCQLIDDKKFKLLMNIGHEYLLHYQSLKAVQAWDLALRVAKTPEEKLEALTFLIEQSDPRKVKNFIREADSLVDSIENKELVITYILCKSECYLYYNFDSAYAAFQKALALIESNQNDLIQARIHLLHHKLVTLPCKFKVQDHEEFSLVKIHQANITINNHYNQSSTLTSYEMRIFFDIYETLVKMYHDLHMPREVRCYSKDAIVVAQKALLPLRTLTFLYYLTFADIRSTKFDDCLVKLKDFMDLVNLNEAHNKVINVLEKKNEKVDKLVEDFEEMMLDVRQVTSQSTITGSPCFKKDTFKLPAFINHATNCTCFYCSCSEYHQAILRMVCLNCVFYQYEDNLSLAKEFFSGGFKFYKMLLSKENRLLKNVLTLTPKDKLNDSYCNLLFEYGNFLIRGGRYKDAEDLNKKVMSLMEKDHLKFVHLYNEVLHQKLNLLWRNVETEEQKEARQLVVPSVNTFTSPKTPISNCSKINYPSTTLKNVEDYDKPTKILPKELKFTLSDSDDDEVKTTNICIKTPAPSTSKIKIYTKSTKKTKLVTEVEIKVGAVEFATPEVTTVKQEQIDKNLASRTKLLTERLKNSSLKTPRNVRVNLEEKLDDGKEIGSLRRSKRKK